MREAGSRVPTGQGPSRREAGRSGHRSRPLVSLALAGFLALVMSGAVLVAGQPSQESQEPPAPKKPPGVTGGTGVRSPRTLPHRSYNELARALASELGRADDLNAVYVIVGFRVPGTKRQVLLSSVLVDKLQTLLVQSGFRVVEQVRVDALREELAQQQADVFQMQSTARIGHLAGATRIIAGTIVDDPAAGTVHISAELIEVESARVLGTAQADLIRDATVIELLNR